MSDRRRDAATATVGLTGVGGAAALRHEALVRSHDERYDPWTTPARSRPPIPRKRVFAERRLIKHKPGRKIWLAGAALGAVSLPAAATGVHGLLHPTARPWRPSGTSDAASAARGCPGPGTRSIDRTQTATEGAARRLVAGNYLAGAGGRLGHRWADPPGAAQEDDRRARQGRAGRRGRRHGGHRDAAAAVQADRAGIPRQVRGHPDRGAPGQEGPGAPRARPPSSTAEAMDPQAFRAQTVGKASPSRGGGHHDPSADGSAPRPHPDPAAAARPAPRRSRGVSARLRVVGGSHQA